MGRIALCAWALAALAAGCTYDCNSSNCSDGCCGANGVCYVGATDQACGLLGATCQDCAAQQRVCSAGTCDRPCVDKAACQTKADCCNTWLCVDQKCVACRSGGQSCFYNEDCCSYPAQTCQQYNSGWFCRSL